MSRKKSAASRKARFDKSQKKRAEKSKQGGSANLSVMQLQHLQIHETKRALIKKIFAEMQRLILAKASDELYGGLAKYFMLKPASEDAAAKIQYEIQKATKELLEIPPDRQTQQHIRETSGILEELHTDFIKEGLLIPVEPDLLKRLPDARRLGDGELEAIDKVNDPDHIVITELTKEQLDRVKSKTVPALEALLAELEEEVP